MCSTVVRKLALRHRSERQEKLRLLGGTDADGWVDTMINASHIGTLTFSLYGIDINHLVSV